MRCLCFGLILEYLVCNHGKIPLVVLWLFVKKCSKNKQKSDFIDINWKMGLLRNICMQISKILKPSRYQKITKRALFGDFLVKLTINFQFQSLATLFWNLVTLKRVAMFCLLIARSTEFFDIREFNCISFFRQNNYSFSNVTYLITHLWGCRRIKGAKNEGWLHLIH